MEDKTKKESVEETPETGTKPEGTASESEAKKPKKKRRGIRFVDAEHDPLLHSNLEPKAYPYDKHWHYPGG